VAYYYLVSQLPNISASEGKSALPLNTEAFRELASRFISEEEKAVLEALSLVPPMELASTGSAFLDVWYEKERNLRCALAQIRAQKLKKTAFRCHQDVLQILFLPHVLQLVWTAL
jgi:hypothetical protein